jgi:hypothetical protein
MKIVNTLDPSLRPAIVMLLAGNGGVGKTTFGATAPKPILADCENGTKYLGLRGIKMDIAKIENWADAKEFLEFVKGGDYETVIIDPLDEMMSKLKGAIIASNDPKLVQRDGSPTMAGWGKMKQDLKDYLKVLRDCGKHVLIIAHVEEKDNDGVLVKRPKVETKLSADIVDMVDIVGYMEVVESDGITKRIIRVEEKNDRYVAKDRTGQLGSVVEPDFAKIINACQGTEKYSWSRSEEVKRGVKNSLAPIETGEKKEETKKAPEKKSAKKENVFADEIEKVLDEDLAPIKEDKVADKKDALKEKLSKAKSRVKVSLE